MNEWVIAPLPLLVSAILLWALAIYLGCWEFNNRNIKQLAGWLENLSQSPSGNVPQALASLLSLFPALIVGLVLFFVCANTLSFTWALTLGFMTAVGSGIYQLGRYAGNQNPSP